jgi:MFS family permease
VSDGVASARRSAGERAAQPWMVANVAMGAAFSAFVALLIPPYVIEATGDAAAAGVVMAVISLSAVLGPVLGTFADRYRAHRIVLSGGVLGMAVGFAAFALSAESSSFYALDAIVLGVSISAVSAIGPVLIVGARLSRDVEARRMTVYSLAMPAGQVIGGVLVGWAATANWSYPARFWMASGVMAILFVATLLTTAEPVRALHAAMDRAEASDDRASTATRVTLRAVLWSTFGIFLVVTVLS